MSGLERPSAAPKLNKSKARAVDSRNLVIKVGILTEYLLFVSNRITRIVMTKRPPLFGTAFFRSTELLSADFPVENRLPQPGAASAPY
ncbi:hypothetical protein ABLN87_16455, partial [Ruegeria sp. SCPT10]|uniref:hypothetical protein n=1 Tax=Ruegeria sp. SCP10 TaxID=3141377 RepID=UPI003338BD94